MKEIDYYFALVNELNERVSPKSTLVTTLAELLDMEKESIYRRLRGNVHFTLVETITIAKKLHISLDRLISNDVVPDTCYYKLNQALGGNIEATDWDDTEKLLNYLRATSDLPGSECAFVMNSFSALSFAMYDYLTRYLHFTRIYRQKKGLYIHYEDVELQETYTSMAKKAHRSIVRFGKIFYVWDFQIIANLVSDIKYYEHIKLISRESIDLIKKDLTDFLQQLERAAFTGELYASKGDFKMFITHTHVMQACSYIGASGHCLSILNNFGRQTYTSVQEENYKALKEWISRLIKLSTQISIAGEKERIEFFEKQKEIIAEM